MTLESRRSELEASWGLSNPCPSLDKREMEGQREAQGGTPGTRDAETPAMPPRGLGPQKHVARGQEPLRGCCDGQRAGHKPLGLGVFRSKTLLRSWIRACWRQKHGPPQRRPDAPNL